MTFNHCLVNLYKLNCVQTILLGDSGVGKTSLLVQFDTGKFQTGTFSATVGIGFTVSSNNTETIIYTGKYRLITFTNVIDHHC